MRKQKKSTRAPLRETDLALERARVSPKEKGVFYKETERDGVRFSALLVEQNAASNARRAGKTLSLSFPQPFLWDEGERHAVGHAFTLALNEFFPKAPARLLVTGLGNRRLTADSLGPLAVEGVEVSAVLSEALIAQFEIPTDTRVAVYVPDVFSKTGIESVRLIEAAARLFNADALLAFDALAAKDQERLFRVIEITDTGTVPGGGVKSGTLSLSEQALGIPVIAVGVPTVVRADEEHFIVSRDMEECVQTLAALLAEGVNLFFGGTERSHDTTVEELFKEIRA